MKFQISNFKKNLKLKPQNLKLKSTQHPTTCPELVEGPNTQHFE
jgi:hypothetical protein